MASVKEGEILGVLVNEKENLRESEQLINSSAEKANILGTSLNKMEHLGELEKLKSMGKGDIPGANVNEVEYLKEFNQLKISSSTEKGQIPGAVNEMKHLKKLDQLKTNSTVEEGEISEKRKELEEWKWKLSQIKEENNELRRGIESLKAKIVEKNAKYGKHAQSFRLRKCIPEKKMVFKRLENAKNKDAYMNISYLFHVAAKLPFKLNRGEALITFEEEKVAQGLIRKHCHTVNLENEKIVVRAQPVTLERGVIFELHTNISQRMLNVSNIPNLNIPMEWMKDKLELHFCKTKLGGEVQNVTYDQWSQMALITFNQPIAINDIVRSCGLYPFSISESTHSIMVSPVIQSKLEGFQIFSGLSRKTILLTGIEVQEEDEESVEDMIAIHFQKPSNGGGEVESIKYVSKGTKVAYFENDTEDK